MKSPMQTHTIEPELLCNPPRRVRRRGTRGYGTLLSQFFVLPVILLSLLMPLWWAHMLVVRTHGTTMNSQIVDRYREWDREDSNRS